MGLFTQLGRDITFLRTIMNVNKTLTPIIEDASMTAADMVERWAKETPNQEAIVYGDRSYTYAEYDAEASKYGHWAQAQGLGKGDVVVLLMENRPEFLFTWMGMAKVGVTTALINTNLTGHALAHCVNIAKAKHIIVGAELAESYKSAKDHFDMRLPVWLQAAPGANGTIEGSNDLNSSLASQPATALGPEARPGLQGSDNCFFIYTSGTTGLPKAARFSHIRVVAGGGMFALGVETKQSDRIYIPLPLYHSSGGIAAVGIAIFTGATIVLVRKFSVTQFWSDCVKYDVTLFQYIGELCRYLLNTETDPMETSHKIRACIGNGLRPEVWEPFQERFKIPRIVEFYGATEGNLTLFNLDGYPGAVARLPGYIRKKAFPHVKLVKFDVETEEPVRGKNGFCIECELDETGELIGRLSDQAGRGFEGYGDESANAKKVLHDVFEKGDSYFRSGDLLKIDKRGYLFFMDRIGDTFRWKGENVATSEVGEALSVFEGIEEANVYGVAIPGSDGRAGMAALVAETEIDIDALAKHVTAELPAYARPLIIRMLPKMEITGTFKHRKVDLVKEGFDPSAMDDPLYFYDDLARTYVPLDSDLYGKIHSGSMRL